MRSVRVKESFFEDIEVGDDRLTMGRTITQSDIVIHAGQTGDFFPHHMDARWCSTQPFGQRMAHGTLVMSVAVGMTAGDVNPRAMSYGYDRVRFVRPVFIGDTITVQARITAKRDHRTKPNNYGYVEEQVTASNQAGEVVLSLSTCTLWKRRPELRHGKSHSLVSMPELKGNSPPNPRGCTDNSCRRAGPPAEMNEPLGRALGGWSQH